MLLHVRPDSPVPVFQQIADEIKSAIARGVCRADEALPSVRQLAVQALVNPNTVAKAYRELEREGIIYTRRGQGVFVARAAIGDCKDDRRAAINAQFQSLVAESLRAGLTPAEIRRLLDTAVRETSERKDG